MKSGKKRNLIYLTFMFLAVKVIYTTMETHLAAFDAKSDADIFLGYSAVSKAFRVFNNKTLNVEETVHVVFDESSTVTTTTTNALELSNRLQDICLDLEEDVEINMNRRTSVTPEPSQSQAEDFALDQQTEGQPDDFQQNPEDRTQLIENLQDANPAEDQAIMIKLNYKTKQGHSTDGIQIIHHHWLSVFKNHGASAGASMSHPHSQILALPVIPPKVSARLNSMKEFFVQTGTCSLCQVKLDDLLIDESSHFISVAPFAATFPFEIWVVPRDHSSHFHELHHEKALDLAGLLKLILVKMSLQLKDPPYNLMIHTAPLQVDATDFPFTHWFIQIVPQLTLTGGFELGTGCYINPVFPEDAAKVLREVSVPNQWCNS